MKIDFLLVSATYDNKLITAIIFLGPFKLIYTGLSCASALCRLSFICPIASFLIPEKDPFKNSTPPCACPTVDANCRGIVTADVLSVRT